VPARLRAKSAIYDFLVAHCVHTADATQLYSSVAPASGVCTVYWALVVIIIGPYMVLIYTIVAACNACSNHLVDGCIVLQIRQIGFATSWRRFVPGSLK